MSTQPICRHHQESGNGFFTILQTIPGAYNHVGCQAQQDAKDPG